MSSKTFVAPMPAVVVTLAGMALAGCGSSAAPTASANETTVPVVTVADTPQADAGREAELALRERELEAREAELELKAKEQELARREAEMAAQPKAVKTAPTKKKQPTSAPAPTAVLATTDPLKATNPPPLSVKATPITVPAGTQLSVGLASDLSTKTAKVGDPVAARLTSDVVIGGRTALAAGSPVRGTVTEVVSGSHKIGGVPTLAMTFDTLELENGQVVPINGRVVRQGKSDTGQDAAKVVGGAAAGAIIGHQIDHDKGRVIGGLLGGAAGAVAAQKTGSEVNVPAGTAVVFSIDAPLQVGG